ncbi:MAG TPA: formyltransferase family protein [Gemmatimonadales bacterium]
MVVAVSGRGSNLLALVDALAGHAEIVISTVISDRAAPALQLARERGIPAVPLADFRDPAEWLARLDHAGCDLLVLAGYLRLVPAAVVAAFSGRIINVHPALLPRHGGPGMHGSRVHEAVLAAGDAESGATVHLVDEVYDRGTILAQGRVAVPAGATAAELAGAVLEVEHRLLPAAVVVAAHHGRPVSFEFP